MKCYRSGDWTAVKPAVDLETTPLEIKTNSTLGSGDKVRLYFFNSKRKWAGGFRIHFSSTLQYLLDFCNLINHYTNFPSNPPTAVHKVWRISLTRTSSARLQVHCNNVEVLNLLPSETCDMSDWEDFWSREVEEIVFDTLDTASDFSRPYQQGHEGKNMQAEIGFHLHTLISGFKLISLLITDVIHIKFERIYHSQKMNS